MNSIPSFSIKQSIMKHKLSLAIPDTMNDWSMTIQDMSVYADLIPVSCLTLQVLVPGTISAITFNEDSVPALTPGFTRHLTACDLELQTESCGTRFDCLPDGIYVIKLSVSPNDLVYVEYNHLRVTQALIKWKKHLCDLELAPCDPPLDKKKKLDRLMEIKGYIEAAKAMVEVCHEAKKGMELFNYAVKLLNQMNCQSC